MVELTTIFGLTQTLAIIVGVIIALMELRHMRQTRDIELETRQAQLFMQIYSQWSGSKYKEWNEIRTWEWDDFDDFTKKYGDLESRNKRSSIGGYFEGIGVLVKEGLIPIRLVALFITSVTRVFWEKFGPITQEHRKRDNVPRIGSETEYLYRTLMKYVEEHPELKT